MRAIISYMLDSVTNKHHFVPISFGSTKKVVYKTFRDKVNDKEHGKQVCKLSLKIFKYLYGNKHKKRRKILSDAAFLHDAGKSEILGSGHSEASFRIINEVAKGLKSNKDKVSMEASAQVARNHRGRVAKDLSPETLELIGVLRLADALVKLKDTFLRFKKKSIEIMPRFSKLPTRYEGIIDNKISESVDIINKNSNKRIKINAK